MLAYSMASISSPNFCTKNYIIFVAASPRLRVASALTYAYVSTIANNCILAG